MKPHTKIITGILLFIFFAALLVLGSACAMLGLAYFMHPTSWELPPENHKLLAWSLVICGCLVPIIPPIWWMYVTNEQTTDIKNSSETKIVNILEKVMKDDLVLVQEPTAISMGKVIDVTPEQVTIEFWDDEPGVKSTSVFKKGQNILNHTTFYNSPIEKREFLTKVITASKQSLGKMEAEAKAFAQDVTELEQMYNSLNISKKE